jgi:MFS family permease
MTNRKLLTNLALGMIGLLVLVGLLLQVLVIPQLSRDLASTYTEYSDQGFIIQVMLSSMVFVGQVIMVLIGLLLSKINSRRLLENRSNAFAQSLAISFAAISVLTAVLLIWLTSRNTLPPALAIALVITILVSSIAGLVTWSLTEVLKEATKARVELERVI